MNTGTMDLWVQQIEGGDPVQLTRGLGACRDPAFSPDGTRIAAYCGADPGGVYIVPALGGLPRKIAEGEWLRFSPDGSKISSVSFNTGATGSAPSIWIAAASGGGTPTELKPNKSINTPPIWRPDGKGLFIVGFGDAQDTPNQFDRYFLPLDGGPLVSVGPIERLRAVGFGAGRYTTSETSTPLQSDYRWPADRCSTQASTCSRTSG